MQLLKYKTTLIKISSVFEVLATKIRILFEKRNIEVLIGKVVKKRSDIVREDGAASMPLHLLHLVDKFITLIWAFSSFAASGLLVIKSVKVVSELVGVVLAEAVPEKLNDGLTEEGHPLLVVVILEDLEEQGEELVDVALHDVKALLNQLLPKD